MPGVPTENEMEGPKSDTFIKGEKNFQGAGHRAPSVLPGLGRLRRAPEGEQPDGHYKEERKGAPGWLSPLSV